MYLNPAEALEKLIEGKRERDCVPFAFLELKELHCRISFKSRFLPLLYIPLIIFNCTCSEFYGTYHNRESRFCLYMFHKLIEEKKEFSDDLTNHISRHVKQCLLHFALSGLDSPYRVNAH